MDQAPRRSWWSRNWKWVVPVGCLAPVVVCCGGGTLLFVFVSGALKSSEPYQEALERAKTNDGVKAQLGEPIEAGFFVSGSVEISGPSGKADLSIPVSGPKGAGTVYVTATKSAGKWQYSTLEFAPKDSQARIDLRPNPAK
jgi:hypothetical protein